MISSDGETVPYVHKIIPAKAKVLLALCLFIAILVNHTSKVYTCLTPSCEFFVANVHLVVKQYILVACKKQLSKIKVCRLID